MERVQSLINKLYQQHFAKSPAADLLVTVEELKKELLGGVSNNSTIDSGSVSVWLPAGFSRTAPPAAKLDTANPPPAAQPSVKPMMTAKVEIKPVEPPVMKAEKDTEFILDHNEEDADEHEIAQAQAAIAAAEFAASAAEDSAKKEEGPKPNEKDEVIMPLKVPSVPKVVAAPENDSQIVKPAVNTDEKPVVYNFDVKTEDVVEKRPEKIEEKPFTKPVPFPDYAAAASAASTSFAAIKPPTIPSKELNEAIAQPVKPLHEKLQKKNTELSDVLSVGSKITDLRKAISINDKYQMINLLFRGDEDMFERSIRTLNNFTALQEAKFWMQRELVVKLGWNEDDELVQGFYKLISRRFL